MTNMNTVLPIAQCWLTGEKEGDFGWALRQLQALMASYEISWPSIILTDRDQACMNALELLFPKVPSLVCRWHMNRNVLTKTRTIFGQVEIMNPAPGQDKFENTVATDQFMELYYEAVDSPTEDDFRARRATICLASSVLADYLDKHWWKYEKKLVRCWISQYLHFRYRDISPAEGTHSKCKRWLESSRGDLLTAFTKLLPWWETCIENVSVGVERDVGRVPRVLQDNRYSAVVMFISRYALNETATLWKDALRIVRKQTPIEPCTGVLKRTNGRPCVYDLIVIIKSERQEKIRVKDFHRHWLTRRGHTEECGARVLDPAPANLSKDPKRRKKHKKNHGNSGTAREPTYSERVDLNSSAPGPAVTQSFTSLLGSSNLQGHTNTSNYPQLPSLDTILNRSQIAEQQDTAELQYSQPYVPARTWGYAGHRPF